MPALETQQTRAVAVALMIAGAGLVASAIFLSSFRAIAVKPDANRSPTAISSIIVSAYFGLMLCLSGVISMLLG